MKAIRPEPFCWPCGASVTLGACAAMLVMLVAPRASSSSALTAVIASGVSCRFCWRNWAVTMISLEGVSSSADWAMAGVPAKASAMALMPIA